MFFYVNPPFCQKWARILNLFGWVDGEEMEETKGELIIWKNIKETYSGMEFQKLNGISS